MHLRMHYDVTFCPIFLKTSIYFLLMMDYHHTKFGLIWIKESKVKEGGGIRPPLSGQRMY